jgi:hypothetical protein
MNWKDSVGQPCNIVVYVNSVVRPVSDTNMQPVGLIYLKDAASKVEKWSKVSQPTKKSSGLKFAVSLSELDLDIVRFTQYEFSIRPLPIEIHKINYRHKPIIII